MRSLLADGLGPGARVGSWVIEAQLSSSGSGTVYRAVHSRTRRRAAVKILHAELARSREASARFARELRATQDTRHPGLARIFGTGALPDGRPWVAMELLEGRDLAALLAERGALPTSEALPIFERLAAALTAAHARGIVHRDIKASNVFLSRGRVVLLDCAVPPVTAIAPEQGGRGSVDARADVYALGVLLFHMLTGVVPFADASPAVTRQLHRWARRPLPSSLAPVTGDVDAVVVRAMARDPGQRQQSVEELVRELRAALASAGPAGVSGVAVHIEANAHLAEALAHFAAQGFLPVLQTGSAAVLLRPCEGAAPSRHERAQALAVAHACVAAAAARLRCYLDVRTAELAGGRVVGGPVLRLAEWVPDDDTPGVHGSSRVLADLEPPPGGM